MACHDSFPAQNWMQGGAGFEHFFGASGLGSTLDDVPYLLDGWVHGRRFIMTVFLFRSGMSGAKFDDFWCLKHFWCTLSKRWMGTS